MGYAIGWVWIVPPGAQEEDGGEVVPVRQLSLFGRFLESLLGLANFTLSIRS